jgi:hypothetical protein
MKLLPVLALALLIGPAAAQAPHELAVSGTQFRLNGQPFPFTGISFFNAIYNPAFNQSSQERRQWLRKFGQYGINVLRIWSQWDSRRGYADTCDACTLYHPDGTLRGEHVSRLKEIIADADALGMVIELVLFAQESWNANSSPDVDPRRYDDLDLAREAARAGMGALLIKSHQASTVERAYLVSRMVTGVRVFGGLVLNETVGGLNPAAVRLALELGARQIWMPTRSARHHRRHHGQSGGISVLGPGGDLSTAAEEILALLAAGECILGTGHLSPEESVVLIRRARQLGVRKILITHPEWGGTFYPVELQRELASGDDLFFERCFVSTTHRCGFVPFAAITSAIAELGPESTVVSTDLGQPDTPAPVEGLRLYAEKLRAEGFRPEQIRQMMRDNPARLLGL